MPAREPESDASLQEGGAYGNPALSNRERILDAAVKVAVRDGILGMTLEAVALEARVSKGGLIYHFRSKDDLIAAMLEHFRAKVQRAFDARMAADPNPQGRWFRAFVHTVFGPVSADDATEPRPSEMTRFLTAMLAASANNPHLLDPVRHKMAELRDGLSAQGPNGMRQLALWPAIYGLVLWQHLGVISPDDPLRQAILQELLTLAEGPDPSVSRE
jgi:AcrR family transcriptional regulator